VTLINDVEKGSLTIEKGSLTIEKGSLTIEKKRRDAAGERSAPRTVLGHDRGSLEF
jgi:hypothetical protein